MTVQFEITDLDKVLIVIFVLLVRTGFTLIHVGCIPSTDANYIYIQHLLSACVTTLVFWTVGHGLSFGADIENVVGWHGCWLKWDHDHALRAWYTVMYASALGQMVSAGRASLIGDSFVTALISGVVHPIILHWVWTSKGWMEHDILAGPFIDHSGASVCHMLGGTVALAAMIILGHRVISISTLDHSSLALNSQGTALIGYALITVGTIVMSIHPPYWQVLNVQEDLVKCAVAFSVGIMLVICVASIACQKFNYWVMIWAIQGGLAGLISLSGGMAGITPSLSIVYSSITVAAYMIFSTLVRATGFEDYCNIIATHLVPGAIATYLAAFSHKPYYVQIKLPEAKGLNSTPGILLWQGICSFVVFILVFGLAMSLYMLLKTINLLRNKPEKELYLDMLTMGHIRPPLPGCCPFFTQYRTTANLIQPNFNTILRFKNKRKQIHTFKVGSMVSLPSNLDHSHPQVSEEVASTSGTFK